MTWAYESSTGKLRNAAGALIATGYAGGNEGKNPEGVNNPAMQDQRGIGPLPFGPQADGSPNMFTFGEPVEHSQLGPFAIPLIPDPANTMFGRSDFYCHGDTTPSGNASMGCVIMPLYIRKILAASADNCIAILNVYTTPEAA